ncbi:MAG TPA: hypothetical protein VM054_11965 [bacterium]|nr:hypothetical protein [bacterium]
MSTKTREHLVSSVIINPHGEQSFVPGLDLTLTGTFFAYKGTDDGKVAFFVMYNPDLDAEGRKDLADFFEKLSKDILKNTESK